MKSLRNTVLFTSLLTLGTASTALAETPTPKSPMAHLVDEGQAWWWQVTAGPTAGSDPTARSTADAPTADRLLGPERAAREQPVIDLSPNASVVARDWRGSMRIVGARSMLVDEIRPTASNRMVIGRISTNEARVSIFAQAGVGEWRVDTVMFPNAVSYSELAGQIGGGFRLRVTPRFHVASEVQYTMLYRDLHYAEGEVAPRMTSWLIAAAGTF